MEYVFMGYNYANVGVVWIIYIPIIIDKLTDPGVGCMKGL